MHRQLYQNRHLQVVLAPLISLVNNMADPTAIDTVADAIANVGEKSSGYDQVGVPDKSGDRPYGKYQIMGNNIPSWSDEAGLGKLTPDAFVNNPDAQEQVAKHRIGKYLDQYGNARDAASLWHSGVPYDQAVNEKRQDSLGTKTADYATRVSNAADTIVSLPDGSEVNLGVNPSPELREQVKAKIREKFPELGGVPQATEQPPSVEQPKPPPTVEKPAWYSGLADEAGEQFANAVSNAIESGKSLVQKPDSAGQVIHDLLGLLEPWTVTGSMTGEAAKKAAAAGGLGSTAQGIAETGGTVAGALATPAPPGFGLVSKALERILGAAKATVPEAIAAARAEAPEAAAAAERVGGINTAPSEATTAAKEVLTPSGAATETIGSTAKQTLTQRAKQLETMAGGVYDTAVENAQNANKVLDPATKEYKALTPHLADVRAKLGTLPAEAEEAVANLEEKIKAGKPLDPNDLAAYKEAVDTTFPGKMKSGTEVRDALRSMFSSEDQKWAEAADALWRDELRGKGMTQSSLGSLVKVIKKSDPTAVVEKLFGRGTGPLSDSQAAVGRAVMRNLELDDPKIAGQVKDALFNRVVDSATDSAGAFNPQQLVDSYENLKPLHSVISTPDKNAFFTVLRNQLAENAKAAVKTKPGMLARMTAEGIAIGIGEQVGAAMGHPYLGMVAAHKILRPDKIAEMLASPKTTRLLTRALQTPFESAGAPMIMRSLDDALSEKPKKAA
jgi:hypothetical protein